MIVIQETTVNLTYQLTNLLLASNGFYIIQLVGGTVLENCTGQTLSFEEFLRQLDLANIF